MSIFFTPPLLTYAVVEHLPETRHLSDPVDHPPDRKGQYRLVCVAVLSPEAHRLAHVLAALGDGRTVYSVFLAEPETLDAEE